MSTRSMTPLMSCSEPIGISVATTCGPKASLQDSSARKKSARSRSSMFTKSIRARSSSSARAHSRRVLTSTPMTPLTTKIADSATRMAPSASAMKLGSPGVSRRLILRPSHSNELSASEIDSLRDCSSGSESETVVPSRTEPSRFVAPASNRSASCSDVLPPPRWPIRATLRMRSAGLCMRGSSPRGSRDASGSPRFWRPGVGAARQSARFSSDMRPRRRSTAFVCSCDTRDSVTPRTSPISRRVRFS